MADVDVDQWLEQWVEQHISSAGHVERKAEMHDEAKACAEAARADGISITELKDAANGDLETFLMERQNVAFGASASGVLGDGA